MKNRTVMVTGLGAVTSLGNTIEETWASALQGKSGIRRLEGVDLTGMRVTIGGQVRDFDPQDFMTYQDARRHDSHAWYGIAAAQEALRGSGCLVEGPLRIDTDRMGVTTATGYGPSKINQDGTLTLAQRGPRALPPHLAVYGSPDIVGAHLSIEYGIRGASYALSAACATGAIALGEALRAIRHGYLDSVLVVGAESSLNRQDVSTTANTRALTTEWNDDPEGASRPFDRRRSGFVMAAGAAAVLLESAESAQRWGREPIVELAGYGVTTDGHHMTAPDPEGRGTSAAMRAALEDADMGPDDIDYVNAHGTSTELNDVNELHAISKVFGERAQRMPISSTKSMTGHLLGAAGVLEAVLTTMMIRHGILLPTINLTDPEFPEYDLVPETRPANVGAAMSNSFGFGGHNASIILREVA
ncbi:beta-ketoacyl-[acyl-carrier-protein] synthase family protein [Micrococcus luteus]|uniref:beta-ketoacyl-[acyl-carrier-protein] synthase family protein n=1 Tax=Micrococcus luteus TaxID=1270 RepID=UPI0015D759D1|nr:beta-ketoacyl-[acyl-carrier-protein] synthase family protein [Micrococcus luteus]